MSHYLDASLVVALLTAETASERADTWITAQSATSLIVSEWVSAEVAGALSNKIRSRLMTLEQRSAALEVYARLITRTLTVAPIASSHFVAATRFVSDHRLSLRAADALHLAIADEQHATLVTLDVRQAQAGRELGVATLLV